MIELVAVAAVIGLAIFARGLHADDSIQNTDASSKQKPEQTWMGALNAYSLAIEKMGTNLKPVVIFVTSYLLTSLVDLLIHIPLEVSIALLFIYALPLYALAAANDYKLSVPEFIRPDMRIALNLVVISILTVLALLGSLLLFVLPIIWTLPWFFFGRLVAVDKGFGPIAALKESKKIALHHLGKVWGIVGFGVLLNIGCGVLTHVIPGSIGILIAGGALAFCSVWCMVASAILYRYLQENI